ncbi:hypothetical protein GCM10007978_48740 [Shewanella hanedai]|uniref:Uncharacterized protein n=1 Tax=Shewanella hanedai TaxID=25 RepID=A0A553JDR2_SHEHA|nr:hypothetical protein [Shewanella hanedai]TRY10602.1 hypothetical protein FN961_25145 [Shewanella hanedai]GGJ05402.1 hypothetical protein GCM10007978_48740 [Shewanella hanedai]
MKLAQVLSSINQVEKSKFISCLDKLCTSAIPDDKKLAKSVGKIDGLIKNASGSEITILFSLVSSHFKAAIQEQIDMSGAQIGLLINILTRDGNSVARTSWVESLYSKEWDQLKKSSKVLQEEIELSRNSDDFCRGKLLSIYHDCVSVAFLNDQKINREARITDDERSILNTLADKLNISMDEAAAIEHLINPVPQNNALDGLNALREMGVLFINRKRSEVLIADEVVTILNELQGKELADKHTLRVLRSFSDAELSNVLKHYGKKVRGIERSEKVREIIHSRVPIRYMLQRDIFASNETQNQRKERLKTLISELDLNVDKIGTTLEDRIDVILSTLNQSANDEFNVLSAAGFKELYATLLIHFPKLDKLLRAEFELEDNEDIDTDKLRSLSITPVDILYLLDNDQIKAVRDKMALSKRGNPRQLILESFSNANDKLIENYSALARRDLASLKNAAIEISEAEIGVKFEEITKEIFETLNLVVDEDLRKSINTAKDQADIIISLSDDDVIIGEAKTCKNGDFAKYSTTSRQVKSYVSRCENQGKRVAQVLIIAPSFSADFIESAEMDTEVNISLLEAEGLKKIYDAYKARRNPKFSAKLLTKGGLLKADLIARNI